MTTSRENGQAGGQSAMHAPPVVSAQEWEAAREQLARQGKGHDPRPGRAGRRATADALDGRREGVRVRRARRARRACSTCSTAAAS